MLSGFEAATLGGLQWLHDSGFAGAGAGVDVGAEAGAGCFGPLGWWLSCFWVVGGGVGAGNGSASRATTRWYS